MFVKDTQLVEPTATQAEMAVTAIRVLEIMETMETTETTAIQTLHLLVAMVETMATQVDQLAVVLDFQVVQHLEALVVVPPTSMCHHLTTNNRDQAVTVDSVHNLVTITKIVPMLNDHCVFFSDKMCLHTAIMCQ